MKQLNKILTNTNWATVSNTINNNNDRIFSSVSALEHAAFKQKGYYKTLTALKDAYPYAESGSQAFVYNASNGSAQPYDIYEWDGNNWVDTGVNGGSTSVNLDSKQDTIHGYTENVTNGRVTQIALQADTIVLGGKASIGQIGDVESSIMISSQQASNAIAKANTLEQSINSLKSPVKPIHLNSQGKLELSVGKGLYVEEGKLCATGASSSGGGGGKTYSEGNGIIITDDKINVNYDADTMCLNSCGGLAVNIGEGFIMKDGKLSVQASVNAGNGLVKKGEELQVSVGTGLLVQDDVYVNLGKGLATDNENKVNVNLDEQTLTTDSSGKVIVNKDGLIGNGLKQEYSKLAVNYGTGLALSNKAIVVKYGSGLDINSCGKLYVKDGGKTYIGGQAIDISGNEISVKYDGVTISTKDTADNSLHVMLGSGLTQGISGINLTEDILNLSTRVYELGDFASSGEAENKAKEASISGDNEIVIMRYTVSSAKKQGVILQQVGDYRTIQYQLWDGAIFTRYIWFTNDTRQTLNSNLNAREKWWKLGATHTNYDSSTRKIHLANKDDNNINAGESAVIPIVSSSVAGLMSSDMLDTLNGSQPQLERYSEGLSGTKTTASINADEISMSGSSLKLHNVLRVCGALFTDLQTKGNININGKSVIASNIDAGELKVLNGASNYGFILRTVDNPNDPQGLMLAELLSTDGYDSYRYTFPAKSGEVALKGDYSEGDGIRIIDDKINVAYDLDTIVLDDCGGLSVNYGRGLEMHCGKLCAVKQEGKTYAGGDGISINNTTNEVSFKYGTSLESVCGAIQVAISSGLEYNLNDNAKISVKVGKGICICGNAVTVALGQGLVFGSGNNLDLDLHEKSGLKINSEGLGVNAGVALGTSGGKLNVQYGTGLAVNSSNQLYVDTEKIASEGIDLTDTKKLAIGTKAAQVLAGSGLKQVGPQLVVDAENLTVGNSDKLAGYGLGYGNGKVPLNAPFPEFAELISMGYLRSDYESQGYPHVDFLKAICKWAIATYYGVGEILLMGSVSPSTAGVLILSLYSSSGYDATSLLPRYCSGCYMPLGGQIYKFYTYDYVWSMHAMASLDSTVAKATMADQAEHATMSDSTRFIFATHQDYCVPAEADSIQIFRATTSSTTTGGDDGWILAFRWENGNYLTQIYVDVDDTHIMSIRHRRADSTWTAWKRIALTDSTVARAIADGCGNIIATTYAEHFIPTNGLAINNDRVLYLPNLSASLLNGAVDTSRNGAQRVLELSCGAITVKLSTGLGIDENGYLYVKG